MFDRRGLISLVAAAAVGMGTAYFIRDSLMVRHLAATTVAPFLAGNISDGMLSRRITPLVQNIANFETFRKAAKPQIPAEVADNLILLMADGASKTFSLEFNYGIRRNEFRDLPEAVAREFGAQLAKEGIGSGMALNIAARSEARAIAMVEVMVRHLMDTTLWHQLEDVARAWLLDQALENANARQALLEALDAQESMTRRLVAMRELRERNRGDGGAASTSDEGNVQVQVTDARFLSIGRQLLAMETERLDVVEGLRKQRERLLRGEMRLRLGELVNPFVFGERSSTAEQTLRAIRSMFTTESERLQRETSGENVSLAQRVVGEFDLVLRRLERRFILQRPEPVISRREAPSLLLTLFFGAVLGAGLVAAGFALRWRLRVAAANR